MSTPHTSPSLPSFSGDPPRVDLGNCEREPIHIPGAVQPHGVLLVMRAADLTIIQASESAITLLGRSAASLLGKSAGDLLSEESLRALIEDPRRDQRLNQRVDQRQPPPFVFTTGGRLIVGGKPFEAIVHLSDGAVILELELPDGDPSSHGQDYDLARHVQRMFDATRAATSLTTLAKAAAEEVRRLTQFDRVMIYRFDAEWNGAVIAESKRDDLEPFLGLNYPASDIPAQARRLYTRNRLRFIGDRDYVPSPIVPVINPLTDQPLDLSHSVLRSVSPIHLEYLRNMGVCASMSVSIVTPDGRLWGLIACHHYAGPRFVSYAVRRACEMAGELVSLQLTSKQESEGAVNIARMRVVGDQLAAAMDVGTDIGERLITATPNLQNLVDCGGAAFVAGTRVLTVGNTPTPPEIRAIAEWLDARQAQEAHARTVADSFATDSLVSRFEAAGEFADVASGLLAVALMRAGSNYLMWFRSEVVRSVDWAGDPAKSVVKGQDGVRLSPRGSFALWKQTVRMHSRPWSEDEQTAATDLRRQVVDRILQRADELKRLNAEMARSRDEALNARANAEAANRLKDQFLATLSHELRTPLNAILGWAGLILRSKRRDEETTEAMEIIERNARAQSQLIEDLLDVSRIVSGKLKLEPVPTDLSRVVEAAVASVRVATDAKAIRLRIAVDHDAGQVQADAVRLQQVVWNLLSNAVKFTPKGGEVRIAVSRVESSIQLMVSDTGIGISPELLPYIFERFRQSDSGSSRKYGGLGLGLAIVKHLVELHGGSVTAHSDGPGAGSMFAVTLPLMPMRRNSIRGADATDEPTAVTRRIHECPAELSGLRVLVVEDEADARLMIVRALQDCDATVTATDSAADAMKALTAMSRPPDVIVSDIGLPERDGLSLIREIRMLAADEGGRVPAIALTAYASAEDRNRTLTAGFQAHLAKPISPQELIAAIASLLGGR